MRFSALVLSLVLAVSCLQSLGVEANNVPADPQHAEPVREPRVYDPGLE